MIAVIPKKFQLMVSFIRQSPPLTANIQSIGVHSHWLKEKLKKMWEQKY